MMDEMDNEPDYLNQNHAKLQSECSGSVDLNENNDINVDISDALSERNKVKFTIHTKTILPCFNKLDFSVVRQHEEFLWLHDSYEDNEDYSGIIIPPAPPRPDFDLSREKLHKLGEGESKMSPEEYKKFKAELEAEYLATFKKTVAMHEVFLQRISRHRTLSSDPNFKVFLEYENDLKVRGKNKKEKISGFFRTVTQTADEVLLGNTNDSDDFFSQQKEFLVNYHSHIKNATNVSDRLVIKRKDISVSYIRLSMGFAQLSALTDDVLLDKISDLYENLRKSENQLATDEDLKLSDTLRYYEHDSAAAKHLLFKRLRIMSDFESANKTLDKARLKQKDISNAEHHQNEMRTKFENLSKNAKQELSDFKERRLIHFKKNLGELAQLEIKHSKNKIAALQEIHKYLIET